MILPKWPIFVHMLLPGLKRSSASHPENGSKRSSFSPGTLRIFSSVQTSTRQASLVAESDHLPSEAHDDKLQPARTVSPIRIVDSGGVLIGTLLDQSIQEFEVIRCLGAGSCSVVYLVREILYCPPSEDGRIATTGGIGMDSHDSRGTSRVYGGEYAIKCVSKANLDERVLSALMSGVTIHQSLDLHTNVVALHRFLETPSDSLILLVMEYVPGENLFSFLEHARDYDGSDFPTCIDPSASLLTTLTSSLLSKLHPSQLLSYTRLRLISSMFSQMCEAVASCHNQQVFHHNIQPKSFIVTDAWQTTADGRQERNFIVKLTNFGSSTASDDNSLTVDCDNTPYMSLRIQK
ncbi:kinase-like protein [Hymenopellis radicata]|nr:kinase-like protein [Hymenopellis radicata]